MVRHQGKRKNSPASGASWPASMELVGLVFELEVLGGASIVPQYAGKLHTCFLDQ